MLFERFLALLRALEREQVDYILIGGAAINLHGIVRATEDIDLFLHADAHNVQLLKRALRSVWDDPEIDQITAEDLGGTYPTVRYGPPGEDFVIDIISRLGTEFSFDDIQAERVRIEDVSVRVATPLALYRMKKRTVRPIDRADAMALRDKFSIGEE